MEKRNLLIIIYLRVILSFVYFLSAIFSEKERDKKAARRLRGLNPSRPAAKPQEITLQTMLRVRNASRRDVIQFSIQQSILPLRIQISIVHYNLLRAAPFTFMKHCCGVLSYSLNDSLFISRPLLRMVPGISGTSGRGRSPFRLSRGFPAVYSSAKSWNNPLPTFHAATANAAPAAFCKANCVHHW